MPVVFVYGPDALQARIYDRVGPSEVVGGAVLEGWQLAFNKPNMKNKAEGLANVEEAPGKLVYGVVYELTRKQLEMLEGYYGGYALKTVTVKSLGRTQDQADKPDTHSGGTAHQAEVFVARRTASGLKPNKTAKSEAMRGAVENGAPQDYVDQLEALDAVDG